MLHTLHTIVILIARLQAECLNVTLSEYPAISIMQRMVSLSSNHAHQGSVAVWKESLKRGDLAIGLGLICQVFGVLSDN